jgi:hypothetical protein
MMWREGRGRGDMRALGVYLERREMVCRGVCGVASRVFGMWSCSSGGSCRCCSEGWKVVGDK